MSSLKFRVRKLEEFFYVLGNTIMRMNVDSYRKAFVSPSVFMSGAIVYGRRQQFYHMNTV